MSKIKAYVAMATLLVAGCAAAPETTPTAAALTGAAPIAAAPVAPSEGAAPQPVADAVLDVEAVNASTAPPRICRQMLRPNSNVIVNVCGTAEQWKIYERAEARNAEATTRMLQGGMRF
jgi:hypothetical protein